MKTDFSNLGISSPCADTIDKKCRVGATVYYKDENVGKIAEVDYRNSATTIRLENGMIFIYKFVDGHRNGFLFLS